MNRRLWTVDELAVVRDLYPDIPTALIADLLDRTVGKVHAIANKNGIHKTPAFLAEHCRLRPGDRIGTEYCYPKGHVPANKGLRRPGYGPGRMKETQFKKGQFPANHDPDFYVLGALRVNADGYIDMRVSFEQGALGWRALHTILWEDAHGPVPPGHALVVKDKERLNVCLENLELITRAELCRRNSVHNLPPELKGAVYALGRLRRRINRAEQNRGLKKSSFRHARRPSRQGQSDGARSR